MQKVLLCGVPYDAKSSFLRGAAMAPAYIRATLHNGSSNYFAENGVDILSEKRWEDAGDLRIGDYFDIHPQIQTLLQANQSLLTLGGDHSISYPVVQAHAAIFGKFDILHIDAHTDLYEEYEGDRYSHACPFARIMEEQLAARLVQVGIRTLTHQQRRQAERYGVEIIPMQALHRLKELTFERPLYISIDLDGFDPAFAPGVSHHEPGGLSPRAIINFLYQLKVPIIGADIVEYNPTRDVSNITAALAAKLIKELSGIILQA